MLMRLRRRSVSTVACADARIPAMVPAVDHQPPTLNQRAEPVVSQIEHDLHTLVSAVQRSSAEVGRSVVQASTALADIGARTAVLVGETQTVDGTAHLLAQAARELTQASTSISVQIHTAVGLLAQITAVVSAAQDQIEHLRVSSGEIGAVVNVIGGIAKQTNLLALNAMIEARRAGDQGRGFAVVAQEVKELAAQTTRATDEVRASIARLQHDALGSVRTVGDAASLVQQVGPKFIEVVAAVEEQTASTAELNRSAEAVAHFVSHVVDSASAIRAQAQAASAVSAATAISTTSVERLHGRTLVVLRNNAFGDRRHHPRLPVALTATLLRGGRRYGARTIDVGRGGFLVTSPEDLQADAGSELDVEIAELGSVTTRVAGVSGLGLHLHITRAPEGFASRVDAACGIGQRSERRLHRTRPGCRRGDRARARGRAGGRSTDRGGFVRHLVSARGRHSSAAIPDRGGAGSGDGAHADPRAPAQCRSAPDVLHRDRPKRLLAGAQPPGLAGPAPGRSRVERRQLPEPPHLRRPGRDHRRPRNPALHGPGLSPRHGRRPTVMVREIDAPIRVLGRHWGGFRMAYSF